MQALTTGRQLGVTLVELMIVVAIISVIAAFGYPSYQNYVRNSKRADAFAGLARMSALQERFFADNSRYAGKASDLGYASDSPGSTDDYWNLSTTRVGSGFSVSATAGGGKSHVDDDCNSLTLSSTGAKTAKKKSGGANTNCW